MKTEWSIRWKAIHLCGAVLPAIPARSHTRHSDCTFALQRAGVYGNVGSVWSPCFLLKSSGRLMSCPVSPTDPFPLIWIDAAVSHFSNLPFLFHPPVSPCAMIYADIIKHI